MRGRGGRRIAFGAGGAALMALLTSCIGFSAPVEIHASTDDAARAVGVALADVTGDGQADPLVLTSAPAIVRLTRRTDGSFARAQSISVAAAPGNERMLAADLDGDDISD